MTSSLLHNIEPSHADETGPQVPNAWTIFPIDPGTKTPLVPWNEKDLPAGTKKVGRPGFEYDGLGLVTGERSQVVIVDLDVKPVGHPKYPEGLNGVQTLMSLAPPEETFRTLSVSTPSGGVHLYYRWPGYHCKTSVGEVGPGVDIKGDGGMVVIPPSLHHSGGRYEFMGRPQGDLTPLIADLPAWLAALIQATAHGRPAGGPIAAPPPLRPEVPDVNSSTEDGWRAIDRATTAIRKCPDGRRNATLFHQCAKLGDRAFLGEINLDEARNAVLGAIADWEEQTKCQDTMERGFAKGRTKEWPLVVIGPAHEECNDQVIEALGNTRKDVYVIGNKLARDTGGNGISAMSQANLGEILSMVVDWRQRVGKEGELKRAHPPEWAIREIYDRGFWDGLRIVEGYSAVPVLRPDGSVATAAGYDPVTRVVIREGCTLVPMTVDEARALLDDVVVDFPFADPSHKAAWFCALLTPLAVHAFTGPMPLFLFEASVSSAGKGLLASVTALISSGGISATDTFTASDEEMRKRITSWAKKPKPVTLLDNIGKGIKLGGPALCAVLTSPDRTWSDRLLGGNVTFEGKLSTVFYATGNNVSIGEDMHRRICPVRLVPNVERPEHREGFRHSDLLAYVAEQRALLTSAALTILLAFMAAGMPPQGGKVWASFGGWHRLVVGTCMWAGYGSPDAAVEALRDGASAEAEEGPELVQGVLDLLEGQGKRQVGMTVQEVMEAVYPKGGILGQPLQGGARLRVMLDDKFPKGSATSKLVGAVFREYKDQVFGLLSLQQGSMVSGYRRWLVK